MHASACACMNARMCVCVCVCVLLANLEGVRERVGALLAGGVCEGLNL